jgi:hypothetical protein
MMFPRHSFFPIQQPTIHAYPLAEKISNPDLFVGQAKEFT